MVKKITKTYINNKRYNLLKLDIDEIYTIKTALKDAVCYLDKIFKFRNSKKNRKIYTDSYGYYTSYKKLLKEIESNI